MDRQFVVNQWLSGLSFLNVLKSALRDASALDMAVSYLQVSGWELLQGEIARMSGKNVRLLITDQFAFTHPEGMRRALNAGVRVRNYVGHRIYHPKVYIAYNAAQKPTGAVVGSANISESGLTEGIEAGIAISDSEVLNQLKAWFDQLFDDSANTSKVDAEQIKRFERLWKAAATKRIEAQRSARTIQRGPSPSAALPGDLNTLEDLLSTVNLPIGILSIDQAGNNVRNLKRLMDVVKRYPSIDGKEKSELHLLGLMESGNLTAVGRKARECKTERSLAETWCAWVESESEAKLKAVNERIVSFRKAAEQFWKMRGEVRNFFLRNLRSKSHRQVLQAIELLSNGSDIVSTLPLSEFKALAPVIARSDNRRILAYVQNKGSRSWRDEDRKTMLLAWRKVR